VLTLSLRDWICAGELGPFTVGATQAELVRAVGRPDHGGTGGRDDLVWKYGDVELLFDATTRPCRIHCVEMHAFEGAPTGGRWLQLDPWIVRSELPVEEMGFALGALGIPYREELPRPGGTLLQLVIRDDPRFHLDFITSDRDGWPVGLHGLWMTRSR
jgi:hypothetical protein